MGLWVYGFMRRQKIIFPFFFIFFAFAFGKVRCGVEWCGVVWSGAVWCGVVWRGVVCRGTVRFPHKDYTAVFFSTVCFLPLVSP